MKKQISLGLFTVALLGVGMYVNLQSAAQTERQSDLTLETIEASAEDWDGEMDLIDPDMVNYTCHCQRFGNSNCAANNRGSECAPIGTGECWSYNRNCSK